MSHQSTGRCYSLESNRRYHPIRTSVSKFLKILSLHQTAQAINYNFVMTVYVQFTFRRFDKLTDHCRGYPRVLLE